LPTTEAHRVFARLTEDFGGQEWKARIEAVLLKVRSSTLQDRELLNDILTPIPPEGQGALRYCLEVMTVIALLLRRGNGRRLLFSCLPNI